MRAAFVSVRGLFFLVVAVAIGAGAGIGGYWVYTTYFPSSALSLEKAQAKFEKAEQVFARDPVAAEPLYEEVEMHLRKMVERGRKDDMDTNIQGFLLRAKVNWKLGLIAEARGKGPEAAKDAASESSFRYNAALDIYRQMLQTHDKDNLDAASALLEFYVGNDELGRAELYADVVARYQLKEGEQPTKELIQRQAMSHYLLAQRDLRSSNPRPDLALERLRKIEALPAVDGGAKEKRWREYAVQAQALKMRLDMARKQAADGVAPPKGVRREDIAAELKATLNDGIAKARKDLATQLPGDAKNPPLPELATLKPTNIRGILDFLTIAIEASVAKEEAMERADLLLAVCEQLATANKVPESTIKTVSVHLGRLPTAVEQPASEQKNPNLRLLPVDWAPIEGRLRKVIELAEAAGAPLDPDAWLELARKAHKDRRWKDVEDSAKKGLELARKHNLGPDYASVQQLHGEAAWALFAQNKASAAGEHLDVMRKFGGLARMANVIDGLAALREGRLEIAVRNLLAAQQDPRFSRSLLPVLGLARAYEGLALTERALIMLNKLDTAYQNFDQLSDEERLLAAELFPSADTVALEALRCHLALNQVEPALTYLKRLEQRPLGLAARVLVINHYLAAGRGELAKGNPLDARDLFDFAEKELKAIPKEQRADPAVVCVAWANVLLTASRPDPRRPLGAAASPSDAKTGPSNVEKAEQMLKDYVASHKEIENHLLWVRWLETHNRLDEANAVLADMDSHFSDHKKTIEAVRARLALVRTQGNDIAQLVASMRGPSEDLSTDVLQILYLANPDSSSGVRSRTALGAIIGPQDSLVLFHLWNGYKAQHAGNFADAARSYGRALAPSRYQAEAQAGLLTSLLGLAAKDSPKSAAELITALRGDAPNDPVLLAAHAEMSRRQDNIQGNNSMEAALGVLERVLTPLNRAAVAADLMARGFYAAGRPDLARTEAARALQLDAAYAPALALAARAADDARDYEACLRYAEELERALYGTPAAKRDGPVNSAPRSVLDRLQPSMADGKYWRAVALEHLGRTAEAQRVYLDLIAKHPTLSAGYLGAAGLREQAKDMPGALDFVRQWRAKDPKDAAGAAAEVRLLAQDKKLDAAEKAATAFAGDNPAALVTVARAFAAAHAYDQAEAWGQQAVQAAKDKADKVAAYLVVGDACRARGLSRQGDARKADIDKALAAYKDVWKLVPGHPDAGYPLAALKVKEGNDADYAYVVIQEARKGKDSQRMVSGDRLTLEQLDALGEVYRASKHAGDAVTLYREAAKQRYAREPRVLLQLGLAYRDQNLKRDALAVLTEAETTALEKTDAAPDAESKARWQAIADQARDARAQLDGKK